MIRSLLLTVGAMVLVVGIKESAWLGWFGVLLIVIGFCLPSRRMLQNAVIDRCWLSAQKELTRRIAVFDAAAGATEKTKTLDSLRTLLTLQQQLGLSDREAGAPRLATINGDIHFLEFQSAVTAAGGGLPVVTRDEKVTAPDVCHFADASIYEKQGANDLHGLLYLTDKRAIFLADEGLTTTPWVKVIATSRDEYTLRIQRRDRERPHRFVFASLGQARIAEWIAASIMKSAMNTL